MTDYDAANALGGDTALSGAERAGPRDPDSSASGEARRAKETAVREKFDMSSTRYYQVLNALIDRPEALGGRSVVGPPAAPAAVGRQRQRSARRLGFEGLR